MAKASLTKAMDAKVLATIPRRILSPSGPDEKREDFCYPTQLAATGRIHSIAGEDMGQQDPDEWRAFPPGA
jgi:hypothetical protein